LKPTEAETLSTAQTTLAGLVAERDRISARLADIAGERQAIAHKALTGNEEARATLIGLKDEAHRLAETAVDVESALRQAERDVTAARQGVASLASRDQARREADMANRLEELGAAADSALAEFITAYGQIEDITHQIGADHLSPEIVRVNMSLAIQTALMGPRLQTEFIAPGYRTNIGALVESWAAGVKARAALVLGARAKRRAA